MAGKTATVSYNGFEVAWVTTEGTNRGSASVKLDSGTATTVSTHASTTKAAEIVDVVGSAGGNHKLVVKVLGTAGHPRVDVDAFIILKG